MDREAVEAALKDGGLEYSAVQQAVVGYVYGDSTCGQRALYPLGISIHFCILTFVDLFQVCF